MARPLGFRRRIQSPIWSHRACKALQIDLSRLAAEDLSDGWLRRRLAVFLSADALIDVSAYGFLGLVFAWARWDAAALKLAYPLVVGRGPSRVGDAADSVLERGVGNRRPAVEMFSLFCGFQLVIIFAVFNIPTKRICELKTDLDSRESASVTPTTPVSTRLRMDHCKSAGNVLEAGHAAERRRNGVTADSALTRVLG